MDEKKENYYSTKQVAGLVGCDVSYISMLCRNKSIECVTVSGRGRTGYKYLIPESVVEDLMLKREIEGGSIAKPKPITAMAKPADDSEIEDVSDELSAINMMSSCCESSFKSLDEKTDDMHRIVSKILHILENGGDPKAMVDWMPTAKEYMEQYRQGYLEGYRQGFRDGDRNSSAVKFSKGDK